MDTEAKNTVRAAGKIHAAPKDDFMEGHTSKLPETYVIFIAENDVMKGNQAVYRVERYVTVGDEKVLFGDGSHILYVNGKYRGDDAVGRLMHDFSCTEPDDMNYDILAQKARYYKSDKEGVAAMCKLLEDMRNEVAKETALENSKDNAIRMLETGRISLEDIAYSTNLSIETVKKLKEDMLQMA